MKLTNKLFLLLLFVFVLNQVEARKKNRRRNKAFSPKERCKYKKKGFVGECDTEHNVKMVTFKLKRRISDSSCAPFLTVKKDCDDHSYGKAKGKKNKQKKNKCKYNKKLRTVSDCDPQTNMLIISIPLRANQADMCPPMLKKEKPCSKKRQGPKRKNGCVYEKQPWSECDVETNTRKREMILRAGEETECLPKKVVNKKCRKACRYIKGDWGPCNATTHKKTRTLTPKPGSADTCEEKTQEWSCSAFAELSSPKINKCKYDISDWSPCDPRTNTRTQQMTLKSGDPNICMRSKHLKRKCKTACKFRRGEWTECDEKTELTTRIDTLVKGQDCEKTREITKKCKRACKYSFGDWGDCDMKTNTRQRVKTLVKGDEKICKKEEFVSKPCTKRDGGERCFFGPWGDFGPCQNGVTIKQRPLLQGGVECERKAVVTKTCSD